MYFSQLAGLQRTMERELAALRQSLTPPPAPLKCPDDNEMASRLSECAVDERLHARRVERIRDLEHALGRIGRLDYGLCEACGEPIPFLRLLAAPAVRLCVDCQQARERALALPPAAVPARRPCAGRFRGGPCGGGAGTAVSDQRVP